ncbi:YesK family protein [Lentibacillus sp. L22]|uniref:YesK family protein n=1 Tax=Lentibacillus TaxID=175304 RepID=UPI0022B1F5A2|nr:YesK family protein [Lentibacillus daqui]
MHSLFISTIIFIIAITLLSLFSKRLEKKILFPIAFGFIGIVLFFISFIIGGWEGMGVGAISVSLFIASIIALIGIVLLNKMNFGSHRR